MADGPGPQIPKDRLVTASGVEPVASVGAARRLAWSLWLLTVVLLVLGVWFEALNAPTRGSPWQQSLGLVPLSLPFATVGALIATRQRHNPIGWLLRHGLRRLYQGAIHRAGPDLAHLQLRGPHDLRLSFSTWLEDAGIPARVIDELMGHQRSRHGELEGGSRIGARYRHTTPEMAARVVQALQTRLMVALQVAEEVSQADPAQRTWVF